MKTLFTSDLKEGMVTGADTYTDQGYLVVPKNTVLTKNLITRIINNNVLTVEITGEEIISEKPKEENKLMLTGNFVSISQSVDTTTKQYQMFKKAYDSNIENLSDKINDVVTKNAPIDVDDMLENTLEIVRSTNSPLSIFTMLSTLKNYDDSTFNHSLNVSLICNIFGHWLNLSEKDIELVTACGLFHDIGKLLIPQEIIKKPGKLTDEEFEIMKSHTTAGKEIIESAMVLVGNNTGYLMEAKNLAAYHHEKWNGKGYPTGLAGEEIPLSARVMAVADVFDALVSVRSYKKPFSFEQACDIIRKDAGTHFDPNVANAFLEGKEEARKIAEANLGGSLPKEFQTDEKA